MKLKLLLTLIYMAFGLAAFSQYWVNGQVTNAITGKPVADANIKLIVSRTSTSTLLNGSFAIKMTGLADTLKISCVGFQAANLPVTRSSGDRVWKVKLIPETKNLQEVVISTGYQSLSKERATGSYTLLNSGLLNQQVGTDIISRLESISSGLFFDRSTSTSPQIEVRGLSTISGPTAPLIIVDNFPYEGDITNINPNDVESITILKDAAAASIWGTRAGNGVIVITTKKSRFNQPLSIDFSANFTAGKKPDLNYLPQMSSSDFIDVEKMLFKNGFYDAAIADPSHPGLTPVVELLNKEQNGTINTAQANAGINAFRKQDVRNDFNKYFYQGSANQQYALTVRGGASDQSWLFTTGYDNDISDLDAKYDRVTLHFQDNFKPLKNLDVSTAFYYAQSITIAGKPGYGDITTGEGTLYPYAQFADANGNPLPLEKNYSLSYLATLPAGLPDWKYYPLTDYSNIIKRTTLSDLTANVNAAYKLSGILSVSGQYQYERGNSAGNDNEGIGSYYVRNLVNEFTQIDNDGNVIHIVPVGGILNLTQQLMETQNLRGQLSLDKTWSKSELHAIAGAEMRQVNTSGNTNAFYGFNPDNGTFGNIDLTNPYPDYVTGAYNYIPDPKLLTSLTQHYISQFANAAYSYADKYTLSASARRDASNLFGVNTNGKWNPLGSIGFSWEVSKEDFYKSSTLPYLRLRATYGLSGNVNLAQTAVSTISYLNNSVYTGTPQAIFNTYANPDLKWETIAMLNLGVDFAAFNRRLSGSIEYYHKKGSDLFGQSPIDYTSGTDFYLTKNVASLSGNGVDITLNSLNSAGVLKWRTTLNFSYYNDKVTQNYLGDVQAYNFLNDYAQVSGVVGKPVYSIFSFPSAGLDPENGNPRGYVNGQVSEDYAGIYNNTLVSQLKYNGSAIPTYFGSFLNTFIYKSLSLDVNISYKLGYFFRKISTSYNELFNEGIGNADYSKRWQKPGDELHTQVPSMIYPDDPNRDSFYAGSDVLVDNAGHIRLQYITLNYDFQQLGFPILPFKLLRVFMNVNNLGLIWAANKDHIDPDYYAGPYQLKPPLTVSFGLKVTF